MRYISAVKLLDSKIWSFIVQSNTTQPITIPSHNREELTGGLGLPCFETLIIGLLKLILKTENVMLEKENITPVIE